MILGLKKKITLLLLFVFVAQGVFSAQASYSIIDTMLLPSTYYVGDLVEYRVKLKIDSGVTLLIPELHHLPKQDWIEIREIQVYKNEVRILFVPYCTGTRVLPQLVLGDVVLDQLKINTLSIFGKEVAVFQEPRDQLELPGTHLALSLLILFFLVLPVSLIVFHAQLKDLLRKWIGNRERGRPYRKLNKKMKYLKDKSGIISAREFFIFLIDSVRRYLTDTTHTDFITSTTKEAGDTLNQIFANPNITDPIVEMMHLGDEIKFGGKRISKSVQLKELHQLKRVVNMIEKEDTKRKNGGNRR